MNKKAGWLTLIGLALGVVAAVAQEAGSPKQKGEKMMNEVNKRAVLIVGETITRAIVSTSVLVATVVFLAYVLVEHPAVAVAGIAVLVLAVGCLALWSYAGEEAGEELKQERLHKSNDR